MSKVTFIYEAKVGMIKIAKDIAIKESHGYDIDCLLCKLFKLKSLILSLERYVDNCSKNKLKNNILYLNGKKVLLSAKNNYFCNQEQMINVNDLYLNCITEQEACNIADEIRSIINC